VLSEITVLKIHIHFGILFYRVLIILLRLLFVTLHPRHLFLKCDSMEDLIERISSGEIVTLLIGSSLSSSHLEQQSILLLPQLYPNLSIILFQDDIFSSSSSSPPSSSSHHRISPFTLSSASSSHQKNIKLFHQILCRSSLLFLIDMQLHCMSSSITITTTPSHSSTANEGPTGHDSDTEGPPQQQFEFSELSQTLLYHLQREHLNTYCLHSFSTVISLHQLQLQQPPPPPIPPSSDSASGEVMNTPIHTPTLSHHSPRPRPPLLELTRLYLNDTKMIHLVRTPPPLIPLSEVLDRSEMQQRC
jgi:hypothetical protein